MKDIYRTKRWNKGLEERGGAKEGEEKRRTPTAEQRFVALGSKADVKTFRTHSRRRILLNTIPASNTLIIGRCKPRCNDEKNSIANSADAIER